MRCQVLVARKKLPKRATSLLLANLDAELSSRRRRKNPQIVRVPITALGKRSTQAAWILKIRRLIP
jgi:hypothetical protein